MYNKKLYLKYLRRPYKFGRRKKQSRSMASLKSSIRRMNAKTMKSGDYVQSKYQFRSKVKSVVNVPDTYLYSTNLTDISNKMSDLDEFVMKPNHLSRGIGIRVLKKDNDKYYDINGEILTKKDLVDECAVILRVKRFKGIKAIMIEEVIHRHPYFSKLCTGPGMPDIRCVYYNNTFLFGVARFPSKQSKGYGNIIRGANFGFFDTYGRFVNGGKFQKSTITKGVMPFFHELVLAGQKASACFGYAFMSIDMTVASNGKIYVIEGESLPQIEYYFTEAGVKWFSNVIGSNVQHSRSYKPVKSHGKYGLSSYFPIDVPRSK